MEVDGEGQGALKATAPLFEYPRVQRDGWEPGAPSMRAMAPSLLGGAVVPLAVYYLVRPYVGGDAAALAIAGIPAASWVVLEWLRRRRLDPIGAIVLLGFLAGLGVSYALGGSAFVLKVRDSAFTLLFGLLCLASMFTRRRPAMFYIGRALSAGNDPERCAAFDALWELPPARATFRIVTCVWGFALIADALSRVLLALVLPTGPFLAASPAAAGLFVGGGFAFTIWFSRWARRGADEPPAVEVPPGGGSTWWWVSRYFVPKLLGRL